MRRVKTCLVLVTQAAISCGCGGGRVVTGHTVVAQKPVAKDATREELLEAYNLTARGTKTLNATVELKPTAGSKYSGVIDEYHEVKAFLLAARPAEIRVIGQAPVIGTTVFDMASDDENFRYYVLTVLRGGYQVEVLREIWFDRADLLVSRLQTFGPKGLLLSDVRLANWEPIDNAAGQSAAAQVLGTASFPRAIRIDRPHDDYKLDLQVTKISLNEAIPAERFKLEQPAGAEVVRVGEATENKQP